MSISVQQEDFDQGLEYQSLVKDNLSEGAVVSFVGLVRDFNQGSEVTGLHIEHYSAMTEKCLREIVQQAREKWSLGRVRVVHRYGTLALGEQIVYVGVTSVHRKAAFAGAEFIMDYLKTQAPFWKKETTHAGQHWVATKDSDKDAADSW
jgi:molybdopterin synthase catalytic subunit